MTLPSMRSNPSAMAEAVDLVTRSLPLCLLGQADRSRLLLLAADLAPVFRGGLEFQLGRDNPATRFLQGFEGPNEMSQLFEAPILTRGQRDDAPWRHIIAFGQAWQTPDSSLNRHVSRIDLAFDIRPSAEITTSSAMFVQFRSPEPTKEEMLRHMSLCLDRLTPDMPYPVLQSIRHCLDNCPEEGVLRQFGILLDTSMPAVRLCLSGIRPESFPETLWKLFGVTPDPALEDIAARLSGMDHRFGLCLDAGETVVPRIGLEYVSNPGGGPSDGWAKLLQALVDMGLCRREAASGIMDWTAPVDPSDGAAPWPSDLILESLASPPDRFSVFHRELAHVRVDWILHRSPTAGAYAQFFHTWERVALPAISPALRRKPPSGIKIETDLEHRRQVAEYYDRMHDAYLTYAGSTFQAALMRTGAGAEEAASSNRLLAERAGIRRGDRSLDAGCGVCGPAIDIATRIPDTHIDGVTISEKQARTGKEAIYRSGLQHRITIHVADYHDLPFPGQSYDLAYQFESSCYSSDPLRLAGELFRVLKPGGRLYIKDLFVRDTDDAEYAEWVFFRRFRCRIIEMDQMCKALSAAGFHRIEAEDLSDRISLYNAHRVWMKLAAEPVEASLTGFPKALPLYFGEIRARRP